MKDVCVIMPGKVSRQLEAMVEAATGDVSREIIQDSRDLPVLQNRKILFAVELNHIGTNMTLMEMLSELSARGRDALSGSTAALLVHSHSHLYTKSAARNIIFLANQLGCRFPGNPVVEATGDLSNLLIWQKKMHMSLHDICIHLSRCLGERLVKDDPVPVKDAKILALHASSHKTSNTLALWHMARAYISGFQVKELHVENGTVRDCKGCSYKTCKHYSKQRSCFYGGIMVEEILPAIEEADAIVWICPNYNDSVSANLMAVINRLTALYRRTKFFNKTLFSVIVSGNSGSDCVAKQLIGSLNVNKSFRLPPYFTIMATANDPGAIRKVPGINERAKSFAQNLMKEIKA